MVESMVALDRDEAGIATADHRVLTLKVLDKLHNMRTSQYLDKDKQRLKSQHTLESMAPPAWRLGLRDVSDELTSIALDRLAALPEAALTGHRALALGALLLPPAVRSRYLDEWLGEFDVLPSRSARARFTLRLILGMLALSLTLRRPVHDTLAHRLLAGLRWILRTDLRTWTPLLLLVGWVVVETARTSLVDAAIALITVPPVLPAGVTHLRAKLGIDEPDETSSQQGEPPASPLCPRRCQAGELSESLGDQLATVGSVAHISSPGTWLQERSAHRFLSDDEGCGDALRRPRGLSSPGRGMKRLKSPAPRASLGIIQ
ncbi:hypothetical protein ACQEU6_01050 [Spirillospora sp. CA-108201]